MLDEKASNALENKMANCRTLYRSTTLFEVKTVSSLMDFAGANRARDDHRFSFFRRREIAADELACLEFMPIEMAGSSLAEGGSKRRSTTWMSFTYLANKEVASMNQEKKLNLNQVQHLLANKPLIIVRLEHSDHNKKVIVRALKSLWRDPKGSDIFKTLRLFLEERAPRYDLTPAQMGARAFLLRQMDHIPRERPKSSSGLAGVFRLMVS